MNFSYQTTTMSEIMSELDVLGGTSRCKMSPASLIALLRNNMCVQHYKSQRDYLTWENKKNKYYYDRVEGGFSQQLIEEPYQHFQNGYNVALVVYGNLLDDILAAIYEENTFAINHFVCPLEATEPTVSLLDQQARIKSSYYEWDHHIKVQSNKSEVTLTKITLKDNPCSEFRIVSLPHKMFSQTSQCKSQIFQFLDNLHKNPQKSGKQVANRLFMKKHKVLNMLLQTTFDDNLIYLLHDCSKTNQTILDFFNKFIDLSNFSIKTSVPNSLEICKIPILHAEKQKIKQYSENQFQFCRRLERKTHKLSIPSPLIKLNLNEGETIRCQKYSPVLNNEEEVQILKSQHLIEISKYHQTIQSLNAKLLILQKEHNVEQLCNVYEKEIMGLELKIQDMRVDIDNICKGDKDELKLIIKRLNEELRRTEKGRNNQNKNKSKEPTKYQNIQNKLKQSEAARQHLLQELKTMTQRLKNRQNQISELRSKQTVPPVQASTSLSVSSEQQLSQLNTLLIQLNNGNTESYTFIKNKINILFNNLHESKQLLGQCTGFLIQLQSILERKIQKLDSNLVLDSNRFIRSFLLKIVEISE